MKRFLAILLFTLLCIASCGCQDRATTQFADDSTQAVPQKYAVSEETEIELADESTTLNDEDGAPSFDLNDSDYLEIMKESCRNLDYTAGIAAEKARNEQIKLLELAVPCISFNDLVELAKVITSECGSSWLSMEWKMAVGEVVLNRVASPEFPNTVYEVIHAHGQYANANTDYFDNLMPFEDCVEAAARLLSGERVMNEPSVVFQSNSKQGSGVCLALYDSYFGYTYLCYSSRPELYGG